MKPRQVVLTKYQCVEEMEVEWTITALVHPGERGTRMDPPVPPEVEYIKVTAVTPGEQPRPDLVPIPKPVEFSPEAFEAVMRLCLDTYKFRLSDLDGEALDAAAEQAQDEYEGAADAKYDERRDEMMVSGGRTGIEASKIKGSVNVGKMTVKGKGSVGVKL